MSARHAALLALLLLPAGYTALAQSDVVIDDAPRPRGTIWTVMNTVEAVVRDNYATVKVIADIGNRGPDPEFPFQVRVPDDAFVTGLTIIRDGQVYEARIEGREAARQEYEAHKRQEQTGGLVEKTRGSSVYAFLINVAEFTSVRAILTYERYLAAEEGVFRLPLEAPVSGFGEDQGARFEVRIAHDDGVTAAWGSAGGERRDQAGVWHLEHRVGPRSGDAATPFDAFYQLAPTADGGSLAVTIREGVGYYAHRFRAPEDARQLPLDLVLVLDTSGSMQGLKAQQMRDAAAQVVGMLLAEDRLHLVFFSSDASSPWRGLQEADSAQRRDAAEEVQNWLIAGGTNIEAGMERGFEAFDGIDWSAEEGRLPVLVFLTDGKPTSGITDRARLREAARDANEHGVHVFALAFGRDADWNLVAGLAADGDGVALRVPEGAGAEVDLRRFMGALTTPVLRNVTLHYQGALTAHHRAAPILFAGSELLVVGTFDPAIRALQGEVRAMAPDGPRAYNFSIPIAGAAEAAFLPRLVAYEEIRRLQDLIAAEGADAESVKQIKELALEHGFVTDYTSLVVTLEPRSRGCEDCAELQQQVSTDQSGWNSAPSSGAPQGSPPPSATTGSSGKASTTGDGRANGTGTWFGEGASSPEPMGMRSGEDSQLQSELQQRPSGSASATPGFEAVAVLGAFGLALLVLRRRGA